MPTALAAVADDIMAEDEGKKSKNPRLNFNIDHGSTYISVEEALSEKRNKTPRIGRPRKKRRISGDEEIVVRNFRILAKTLRLSEKVCLDNNLTINYLLNHFLELVAMEDDSVAEIIKEASISRKNAYQVASDNKNIDIDDLYNIFNEVMPWHDN